MDRYIYVRSDESDVFFSDNENFRFRIQLQYPLNLQGIWKVALVEFHATETSKSKMKADEALYVYCNLGKESIVQGEEHPLLRRLEKNSRAKWDYIFDTPFYVKVAKKEIRDFEIYIKGENGADATDLVTPVHLTLHLKPYPFL